MPRSILVDRLTKRYRLGVDQHTTIRDAVASVFRKVGGRPKAESGRWLTALDKVSFEINRGEAVGIIGRNGAGKSTLLKLLSRITYPTSGSVHVSGSIASLIEVGTGFHEELTGRENIYLNGSILGMPKKQIDASLDRIVEFADISGFLDTPIKRYSSGMRMRLGFSVAAHLNPDVLLVDEVLAVGDVVFQKKCLGAMNEFRTGGRTILFVSHNLAAVENLCKRAIWISDGKVQMDGDSRDVIRAYMRNVAAPDQGCVDLRTATARSGTGAVRFTHIQLLDADGTPLHAVHSGDPLTLKLHYTCTREIQHLHFGIRLFSNLGTKLTDLHTWGTGVDIPYTPAGSGSITLDIDFLNLMPGSYYLGIWAAGNGAEWHDVLDQAMTLEVEPSDYFGSGRGIESRFGLMFFPCRWKPTVEASTALSGQNVP